MNDARCHPSLPIDNRTARRLWLQCQGLSSPPSAEASHTALAATVERLGMVQLDPLAPLARAHHHILWTRHSAYRPKHYDTLLEGTRCVFEHFTHDAAILPMALWPYWARARARCGTRYGNSVLGKDKRKLSLRDDILARISETGPLSSRDFDVKRTGSADKSKHAWARPPHKMMLEQLWLQGHLAVSHRRRFHKFYDLAERVIPKEFLDREIPAESQTDTLCSMALERLGMATRAEIQRFWDSCTSQEVQRWLDEHRQAWTKVSVEDATGKWHEAIAPADIEVRVNELRDPPPRVRILNPFDPLVRDRARIERLFGFNFRIEIYVPVNKRQYGYYVFPVLEACRLIGRIEVRTNKECDRLDIQGWWPESGVRMPPARRDRIHAELKRLTRLAGVKEVGSLELIA